MKKRTTIIAVILSIIVIMVAISSCGDGETEKVTQEINAEKSLLSVTEEQNTSAMVDAIIKVGMNDAKVSNDDLQNESLQYIKDHLDNLWESNDVMEHVMYYGTILEYGSDNDTIINIGIDAVQAVKYVYRGTEKTTDQHATENIQQITEGLDKL